MSFLKTYPLRLTPLSPVHIGCGDDYEPTNYVIDGQILHAFDPARLCLDVRERQELMALCDKPGDAAVRGLQSFFAQRKKRCMDVAHARIPVSPGVAEKYRDRIGKVAQHEGRGKSVNNVLQIARTATNPHAQQPILPGSSLKGFLRTAILDRLNHGENRAIDPRNQRHIQNNLLGGEFQTDPLRLVKVSDAQGEVPRRVCFQVNRRKKDSTIAQNQELFLECLAGTATASLTGELTLQDNPRGVATGEIRDKTPSKSFALQEIAQACNAYAFRELNRELAESRNKSWFPPRWSQAMERLIACTALQTGHVFLTRVGRHCGAESVTVAGLRSIKIMGKKGEKPRQLDHALTAWMAADSKGQERDLLPFGWILVETGERDSEIGQILLEIAASIPKATPDAEAPCSATSAVLHPAALPVDFTPTPKLPARLRHDSKDLPAVVVDETTKPCLVRLDWEGAPELSLRCSGYANARNGERLLVSVSEWDKNKQLPKAVRLQRIF
ncbi:MAG TPA: RAMP superfamily CRISPR-associated protein [Fibrobacteria bacterium]|nr:RAMP superfamily CRISPR-associated protein [Fibrobacteria bacterium]